MSNSSPVPGRWELDQLARELAQHYPEIVEQMSVEMVPVTPPRDFPPDDWAVIRSVGELCRYDDRIWRWDGHDWQIVVSAT